MLTSSGVTPSRRRPLLTLLNVVVFGVALSCDSDPTRPGELSWHPLASLPAPRRTGHLAALDGELYYIGGDASLLEDYVSSTLVFNPRAGTWSTAAAMPTARGQGAVAVLGGRIHVIGGANPSAPDNVANRLRTHEAYDPGTNTWETLASISAYRGGLRADTLDGLIYVVGGTRGGEPFDSVEAYNPTSDSWAPAPSLPSPRITFGIGSIGGQLYVAGGEGASRSTLAELLSLDLGTNAWPSGAALPSGRHRVASAVQAGRLIVLGGLDAVDFGQPLSEVIAYDPQADTWSDLPSLPIPLVDAAAAVLDGKLYVVGGITADEGVTDKVFVLTP